MASRIPPLLEPYLSLPLETSLILLTNVLEASTNWLILRFLHNALHSSSEIPSDNEEPKVLLVSFMRDLAFWKENGRRLGLDFEKLALKKRFSFVDGLSGLFLPKQKSADGKPGEHVLSSAELLSVTKDVLVAIEALKDGNKRSKVLLVVDQLDFVLAAGLEGVNPVSVDEMLLDWREEVHSTVVSLSADYPLISAQQTSLENNHAAFLINIAHQADLTMSLRLLDTGTARDVSGVVRITAGEGVEKDNRDLQRRIEDKELLYFVGGDGGVRVFVRGQ